MMLKRVPTHILVALGLGCGPAVGNEGGASQSTSGDGGEDVGDVDISGCLGCLSNPTSYTDDGEDADVGPCLTECLAPITGGSSGGSTSFTTGPCLTPIDTDTFDGTGTGTSDGTGTGTGTDVSTGSDAGTDTGTGTDPGSGTDTDTGTDTGSGTDPAGASSGTSGGTQNEGQRARWWREALERMEADGKLPSDVLARLREYKGARP